MNEILSNPWQMDHTWASGLGKLGLRLSEWDWEVERERLQCKSAETAWEATDRIEMNTERDQISSYENLILTCVWTDLEYFNNLKFDSSI